MEKEPTDFIPLLEDIETPVEAVSEDSIYPVKNQNQKKKCKCKKRIKKCLKVLCKVALIGFLIFGVVAAIAGYRWHKFVSHQVQKWTVLEPNPLPVKEVPVEQLEKTKDAARFFYDAIQMGHIPEDFVLTAKDLNGFFAWKDKTRGNLFAEMKENEYQVSVSMPTDRLPGGRGRYFVATKTLKWDPETHELSVKVQPLDETKGTMVEAVLKLTSMEDDPKTLNLEVLSGQAFGHVIPQDFIDEHYNLLEDLYNCDCHDWDCKHARKFVEGLAGVSLEDGQVVVHADPEPKEATYYKDHEGHSWHHGHHGHHGKHHGKHGRHHGKHHGRHNHDGEEEQVGEEHNHHNGGHHHHHGRHLRAKIGGRHHWKALHMARKLMAL